MQLKMNKTKRTWSDKKTTQYDKSGHKLEKSGLHNNHPMTERTHVPRRACNIFCISDCRFFTIPDSGERADRVVVGHLEKNCHFYLKYMLPPISHSGLHGIGNLRITGRFRIRGTACLLSIIIVCQSLIMVTLKKLEQLLLILCLPSQLAHLPPSSLPWHPQDTKFTKWRSNLLPKT